MSNREDFLRLISGSGNPEKILCGHFGFWDEKSMHKLAPRDCYDENTLHMPQDEPPRDCYSTSPRTEESRKRAVRMAQYLDKSFIGVGKGGVAMFGHGGPGEIQPRVIERTKEYRILQYEGGHKRRINDNPYSIRYYDFPVKEEGDLDRLELPNMRSPDRFGDVAEDCRFFKDAGFVPTGSIQGFFAGIHNSFMDFEDTLVNLLLKPGFMKRLTERLARMNLEAVEMFLDRGVEVIDVCDDLGNASGLIISPELFREFFLPWYEELVRLIHRRGGYLHLHSHGNISPILGDIAAIGVDIVNPFDWEENPDLPELVKKYGSKFIFCGGSVADVYQYPLDEVEPILRRACRLSRFAEKGYLAMGNAGMEYCSVEQWEATREIFLRVRIEEARRTRSG